MNTEKERLGWPEAVLFLLVLLALTACGGPPVAAQPSHREPQVVAIATDDPTIRELPGLPSGGSSITIDSGMQPLLNTNVYPVGAQCADMPSVANRIEPGSKYYDLVGLCQRVTIWRINQ
jgi:hypothetical protein